MNRRLYRSSRERVISGVAGGVAEYFDIDPSIVRIAWVLLALITGGVFLVLYGVMWLVVPVSYSSTPGTRASAAEGEAASGSSEAPPPRPPGGSGSAGLVFGLIFVGLGLYFLAREYLPAFNIDRLWPLGLVALGVFLLIAALRQRPAA
jgi:phage shock protein C